MKTSLVKVSISPQNIEVELPVNSDLTELEFELHNQEAIPFGCRSGACGACLIEVVSGGIDALTPKGDAESAFLSVLGYEGESYRLACQCRVLDTVTISPISQRG